jgi:hypothetical protein
MAKGQPQQRNSTPLTACWPVAHWPSVGTRSGKRWLANQGWTRIEIAVVHAQARGDVVLVASTFTAQGSRANEGKTLAGKSTHALTKVDGVWLSAMHTAA